MRLEECDMDSWEMYQSRVPSQRNLEQGGQDVMQTIEWHISWGYQVEESSSKVGRMWHKQSGHIWVKSTKSKKAQARWGRCDAGSWVTYWSLFPSQRKLEQGERQSGRCVTWGNQVKESLRKVGRMSCKTVKWHVGHWCQVEAWARWESERESLKTMSSISSFI